MLFTSMEGDFRLKLQHDNRSLNSFFIHDDSKNQPQKSSPNEVWYFSRKPDALDVGYSPDLDLSLRENSQYNNA